MRRAVVPLLAIVMAAVACAPPGRDAEDLRGVVNNSAKQPRTFTYEVISPRASFEVRGRIEDDFRYGLALSSKGSDLVELVAHDDGLAVRLADPDFAGRVANELGHPTVDAALRAGRWVVDPSGAPSVVVRELAEGRAGDPFREARDALRGVLGMMEAARDVKRFTLEDIEYRPLQDPWRYPDPDTAELRYDLRRPFLPRSESQAAADGAVTLPQFRKVSVFVLDERATEVCEVVDILGHEEFVTLRQRGEDSNPFLATVLERILAGETTVPIEPRQSLLRLDYSNDVTVEIPPDAVTGQLDIFTAAFSQAFAGGLLRPEGAVVSIPDCLRADTL